ncbi:ABC transporter ATP-binding protein [Undibacterium seohonense]|uniref:ABC transporter ATP-binding protein n=1 Tax=Undibacterium seohonense TaxID=1344950 RepID=A0ABR6X853_9BURK|nr:peptide ABC transporter ATP-binding protein [Undibacterium seohonense]MBC3808995.1 ABC transporter ATP-binding protein [Undibacterium seohonense]
MQDQLITNVPPVLEAQQLTRHYSVSQGLFRDKGTVKALNGVSFTLKKASTLAVVGESGCGKSTLARQLTMIEKPSSGRLLIDGVDVATNGGANNPALRRQLQMVFQNPYASLNPRKSIDATLQEPLRINTALTASERRERVDAMLQQVGLRPEFASRYPHMFSGGQRQRVAIARAMMLNPAVVVADEPVSALDVSIQAQILNLFMDLQASFNTSYVFISHNLSVVEHVADEVLVMYLGSAVEYGSKQALFENPLHPYTRVLISATPAIRAQDRKERIRITGELPSPLHPPAGCAFSPRCPFAQSRCHTEAPALRQVEGRLVACHIVGT